MFLEIETTFNISHDTLNYYSVRLKIDRKFYVDLLRNIDEPLNKSYLKSNFVAKTQARNQFNHHQSQRVFESKLNLSEELRSE